MSDQKWVRSSLRHLSTRLAELGHRASPPTVRRLLRKLEYSLKANRKERETGSAHPERDAQFMHIEEQKQDHREAHMPIISVDTKKKDLIGDFKNAGRDWCQDAELVKVHDFPSEALGRSVPYGVYDLERNRGYVRVGTSADTPPVRGRGHSRLVGDGGGRGLSDGRGAAHPGRWRREQWLAATGVEATTPGATV
jgi:hypothetical protein